MCSVSSERVIEQDRINELLESFDLSEAVIVPVAQIFYRVVNYRYSSEPLSTKGAELTGGRYNFKSREKNSFPCLYCGEEEFTASTEKFYKLRINNQPRPPHTVVGVDVKLSRVLDLRTPDCCAQAGVNWNAINEPWEYHQDILEIPAYSQMLGMMTHEDGGIEGIIFTSTKVKASICIAIFTERMIVGSSLSVYDPRNEFPEQNKVIKGLLGFSNKVFYEED